LTPTPSRGTTASATPAGQHTAGRPKRTDCTGKIVVVHNGIIENYLQLKQELKRQGHTFITETDTEIVAHLVEREMRGDGLENAVRRALMLMRGLFALVLISADDPEKIVAVRRARRSLSVSATGSLSSHPTSLRS
jgi:glucosamine--fructose-6-phosphate aminotransferase (isomerizing)